MMKQRSRQNESVHARTRLCRMGKGSQLRGASDGGHRSVGLVPGTRVSTRAIVKMGPHVL